MTSTYQALLQRLQATQDLEFHVLLEAVHSVRFTGPLTIDFLNGIPQQINLGQPVKLAICHATSEGGLDKPRRPGSG